MHALLWFFQRVIGNMSIKCSPIVETFCRFSLDVRSEKVENGVTLLIVHLAAVEFDFVFQGEIILLVCTSFFL